MYLETIPTQLCERGWTAEVSDLQPDAYLVAAHHSGQGVTGPDTLDVEVPTLTITRGRGCCGSPMLVPVSSWPRAGDDPVTLAQPSKLASGKTVPEHGSEGASAGLRHRWTPVTNVPTPLGAGRSPQQLMAEPTQDQDQQPAVDWHFSARSCSNERDYYLDQHFLKDRSTPARSDYVEPSITAGS